MDTLDITDEHFDRKMLDLQRRYDEQYDTMEEIETQIDEVKTQIQNIQQEKISGDNIYQLLLAFDEVYGLATEAEQKEFMQAFIERIDLYSEKQKDGNWIRNITFAFPVPVNGKELKELSLETGTTVETVCQLVLRKPAAHINIDVDVEELVQDKRGMATYGQIKDYVLEHRGLKVSSLYIAQVKQKCGIIERENYNKPKSEDAKQPQCPPEKEKAIMEVLKHFGMLSFLYSILHASIDAMIESMDWKCVENIRNHIEKRHRRNNRKGYSCFVFYLSSSFRTNDLVIS